MADFMTVLAASQKQAPTVANGKALAGLLPEGLFGHVLAEQIGAKAVDDSLPLLLAGAIALTDESTPLAPQAAVPDGDANPLESAPRQYVGVDPVNAEEMPVAPPPHVGANTANTVSTDKTLASSSLALAAAGASVGDKPDAAPGARQLLSRSGAEMVATSAAPEVAWRQDLPSGEAVARVAAVAVAPVAGGGETAAVMETMKPLDQSLIAATRQPGSLEQLARPADVRAQAVIEAPLRSQQFPVEFSEKIVWMVGRQSQVADLSLNPPQLGALEVRLSLSAGEAGAQFYSPNPVVRDAIEAALPRLRELMAQAGIALGDAQVRDEAFARQEAGESMRAQGASSADDAETTFSAGVGVVRQAGLGLVDLYV